MTPMDRLSQLPFVRWVRRYRGPLSIAVIVVSLALLGFYVATHQDSVRRLLSVSPWVLLALGLLYAGVVLSNVFITYATVKLCKKELPFAGSVSLTVYSTVANFFGPLQSGPGLRAVYLKTKIGLRIRDYTYATLFYYGAFGILNVSLLFINSYPLLTLLGIIVGAAALYVGVKKFRFHDRLRFIVMICMMTLAQILLTSVIYFIELHATQTAASYMQALVYSASANLSLFVSITPGGIGIREAFIIFTQSLHHISLASIVAAGVLDRAFYVLFLVVLFAVSSALHIKQSLLHK